MEDCRRQHRTGMSVAVVVVLVALTVFELRLVVADEVIGGPADVQARVSCGSPVGEVVASLPAEARCVGASAVEFEDLSSSVDGDTAPSFFSMSSESDGLIRVVRGLSGLAGTSVRLDVACYSVVVAVVYVYVVDDGNNCGEALPLVERDYTRRRTDEGRDPDGEDQVRLRRQHPASTTPTGVVGRRRSDDERRSNDADRYQRLPISSVDFDDDDDLEKVNHYSDYSPRTRHDGQRPAHDDDADESPVDVYNLVVVGDSAPTRSRRSVRPLRLREIPETTTDVVAELDNDYAERFAFREPAPAFLEINPVIGTVRLRQGERLDYEKEPELDFTVIVTRVDNPSCEY